jgi:DNA-binding response OmpR family regulator
MQPKTWRGASLQYDPILVVGVQPVTVAALGEMLRGFGPCGAISQAASNDEALALTARLNPKLIFVEPAGAELDGLQFVRDLRRSGLAADGAPVILICAERTVTALREAQNAGVHEFLVRPISPAHLLRRLDAVVSEWRPWIETESYVGPDRRRFDTAGAPENLNRRKNYASSPDGA